MFLALKKIIRIFIPPVCRICFAILAGIKGKILMGSKQIRKYKHRSGIKRIFILANGPSLNDTLTRHKDILKETECVAVNMFAYTDFFIEIKPLWYVLADPAFF